MVWYGEFQTDATIRSYFPDMSYKGTLIEVGAGKPDFISLSKHFKESGWTVICVEANPEFARLHREVGNRIVECAASNYNADDVNFTVCRAHVSGLGGIITMEGASALKSTVRYQKAGAVTSGEIIKVKVRTLDSILAEMLDIKSTDVVTIDVEGGELDVLGGFTQRHLYPYLFVIECLFEDRIGQDMALMNSLGYKFVTHQAYNYFYLRTS